MAGGNACPRGQATGPRSRSLTVHEDETLAPTYVLLRGDPKRKGAVVSPAYPRVLVDSAPSAKKEKLDRRDLAEWITQTGHPLTARVLVNRLWQHHFGKKPVAIPNDFGTRGRVRPIRNCSIGWPKNSSVPAGRSSNYTGSCCFPALMRRRVESAAMLRVGAWTPKTVCSGI